MQTPERRPPVGVAFDSSMGDSIDQVLALAMLLGFNVNREIRLASLSISKNNLEVAGFCDLMSRFFGSSLPIGMLDSVPAEAAVPPMVAAVVSRTAEGKPVFARTVAQLNDTADPVAVIRNGLTAQQDQNAVILLSGLTANLRALVALPGGAELIQKKVRTLVIAPPLSDTPGLAELLTRWPGSVVFAGEDVGESLKFPGQSVEEDFAYAANHPVVDAYRAAGTMPYDAPAGALAAVVYAVHPNERYFALSEPGTMTVRSGRLQFAANAQGKHRRLVEDPQQREKIIPLYRQVVSTKPPERRGGRGPQQ